jgi:CheY-like chemotaxis protein
VKPSSAKPDSVPPSGRQGEQDLAGALHEVSNALTVVLGWLDVAHAQLAPGAARQAIEIAHTHARLGHGLARSAIGAELPEPSRQATSRSLAESAAVGVRPQADRRGVRIHCEGTTTGGPLVRDADSALQILTNLLLNAIDFSPEGSVVTLELTDSGSNLIFAVSDQGPGIDPDRIATLLSGPVSTRRGGAGVGLRHSAALARSRGGALNVVRSSPGARFELRWPIAEARSGAQPKPLPRASVSGARVLVIEDDAAVRSLVELALEARGAVPLVVASAAQFEAVLARGAVFDAALIDLSPIATDTRAAFDRLRASNPGIPIILISGVASGVPESVADQVAAWVRKPFEMGEVLDVLAETLASRPGASD